MFTLGVYIIILSLVCGYVLNMISKDLFLSFMVKVKAGVLNLQITVWFRQHSTVSY